MTEINAVIGQPFTLSAPEVLTPLPHAMAKSAVPLGKEVQAAVDAQVNTFVDGLLTEDLLVGVGVGLVLKMALRLKLFRTCEDTLMS